MFNQSTIVTEDAGWKESLWSEAPAGGRAGGPACCRLPGPSPPSPLQQPQPPNHHPTTATAHSLPAELYATGSHSVRFAVYGFKHDAAPYEEILRDRCRLRPLVRARARAGGRVWGRAGALPSRPPAGWRCCYGRAAARGLKHPNQHRAGAPRQGCIDDAMIDSAVLGGPAVFATATLASAKPAAPFVFRRARARARALAASC